MCSVFSFLCLDSQKAGERNKEIMNLQLKPHLRANQGTMQRHRSVGSGHTHTGQLTICGDLADSGKMIENQKHLDCIT